MDDSCQRGEMQKGKILSKFEHDEFIEEFYRVASGTHAQIDNQTLRVNLPAGRAFQINLNELDFSFVESSLDDSGKLYLYAGQFLTTLPRGESTSEWIISKFYAWMADPRFREIAENYYSWDHATAMRIETSQYLKYLVPSAWTRSAEVVHDQDIDWGLAADNIGLNNHGVFLVTALLFVAKVGGFDPETLSRKQLIEYSAARLMEIVDHVYDSEGWCAENSPQYDRVWLHLLRRVNDSFSDVLSESSVIDRFSEILEKASHLVAAQVYHDGFLVPRGDTQRIPTNETTLEGTHSSTRVGIWTHSNEDYFVMATAGHSSLTHKHVDDNQVLLSYRSVDFLVDGGHHGYVYEDPRVPALKAATGHSVLSATHLNSLPPWLAYRQPTPPIRAQMLYADEQSVLMSSTLQRASELRRHLTRKSEGVVVVDTWNLSSDYSAVVRFIVPGSCFIEWDSRALVLTREGKQLILRFSNDIDVSVFTGEGNPPYRGWVSLEFGTFEPAHCIEIYSPGQSSEGSLAYTIEGETLTDEKWASFKQEASGQFGGPLPVMETARGLWRVSEYSSSTDVTSTDHTEISYQTLGDQANDKAGVLEIAFYDSEGQRLAIPDWKGSSQKFGDYKYLRVDENGNGNDRFRIKNPQGATSLVLTGHRWLDYGPLYFLSRPLITLHRLSE
jgi:hypothetical protein